MDSKNNRLLVIFPVKYISMRSFLALLVFLSIASIHSYGQNKQNATLNHIAQYVVNLKTSTDFYISVVGLDTIPEPFHDGRHTWFTVGGNSHLHLIQGAKKMSAHEKNSHLCFSVASVTEFIKILEKNKVPYENWVGEKTAVTSRVDGVKQIYFKDPDGYWIEINDAK
jgi:lactoylglutathione lyase